MEKQQQKNEIEKLMEEKNKEMAKMEVYNMKELKSSIRCAMPAELMNELFGSLPFEYAFGLLAKMPNGLLARNVQIMINGIKMAMKENKWSLNLNDRTPNLAISEDGFKVMKTGFAPNFVRAILPIPSLNLNCKNPIIVCYYEAEILAKQATSYGIGFFTKKFKGPLISSLNDSIGICWKICFQINSRLVKFENGFNESNNGGNIIGIGIIRWPANSLFECFGTFNGQLLGKTELPAKFANLQFFPSATLFDDGNSLRANFGKEEWRFKQFESVLQ